MERCSLDMLRSTELNEHRSGSMSKLSSFKQKIPQTLFSWVPNRDAHGQEALRESPGISGALGSLPASGVAEVAPGGSPRGTAPLPSSPAATADGARRERGKEQGNRRCKTKTQEMASAAKSPWGKPPVRSLPSYSESLTQQQHQQALNRATLLLGGNLSPCRGITHGHAARARCLLLP